MKVLEPRIVPLPYEEGTYWRKGAKEGAESILKEFRKIRDYSLSSKRYIQYEKSSLEYSTPELSVYDKSKAMSQIEEHILELISKGYSPIILGGDHSVTLPVIRALTSVYGKKSFSIIHLDAHSDTFEPIDGYRYHHGAVFKNIIEEGLVDAREIFQFGIRGSCRLPGLEYADTNNIPYVLLDDFQRAGCRLENYSLPKHKPYYVSIDIDSVDPAFAPGTGTPVPGGLTSSEALDIVRQLVNFDVIGLDIVEVAPIYDQTNITSLLAAYMLFEALGSIKFVALS